MKKDNKYNLKNQLSTFMLRHSSSFPPAPSSCVMAVPGLFNWKTLKCKFFSNTEGRWSHFTCLPRVNDSGGVLQTKPGTDNSCRPLSLKDDNNEHFRLGRMFSAHICGAPWCGSPRPRCRDYTWPQLTGRRGSRSGRTGTQNT